MSVQQARDFLSDFIVEDALRSAEMLLENIASDVPPTTRVSVGLEFLIVGVHFLEREIHRVGLQEHFDSFIQPIRQLALLRYCQIKAPGEKDLQAFMDVWDSALHTYYSQEHFYRKPMTQGSKESVSGQFGTRVAAVFGEGEFSFIATSATLALGAQVIAHANSKLFDKTFNTITWQ